MGGDLPERFRIALALLIPVVALGMQWVLWPWISPFVWFLFYPAVFFSARVGGLWGGLAGTVLSAAFVVFFFIPPQLSWQVDNPVRLWSVGIFLVLGYLISDVHERLRCAQRAAESALAEARAANSELEGFAYAVAHDLRAPLRALSGFSQALEEDYGDRLDGEAKTWLDQIGLASRKMGELIEGILTLSRVTRGELRRDRIDLSTLATQLLEELARTEPARQVRWQVEPGLAAMGDARMIEDALRNLLGNAWKYTAKTPEPLIRVRAEKREGVRYFCIADNGAGFDMAHANRLFQPFQRLHRQDEFPGIGIGLATVQRIVHRHGGEMRAEGRPGEGATFCFTLPGGGDNKGSAT